jgi:HlyD family secretion protein
LAKGVNMKKWLKRTIIIVVIIGAVVGAYFIYNGVTEKAQVSEAFSTQPSTGVTTTGDITLSVSGSGNLVSAESINLKADAYMVIDELQVEVGDTIAVGQTIATLDAEDMEEYLADLEEQMLSIQTQIDTTNNVMTSLSIKSTTDGWIKNVMLDDDEYIEDAMGEYGYVALVATEARELINAQGSGLLVGDEVKVKSENRWHTGVVVSEDDTLYVSIDTVYRTVGAEAIVYDTDKNELFTSAIELASYELIESNFGIITDVKFSEDEEIEAGDTIYRASQYSLDVAALYESLRETEEEYEVVSAQLEQAEIKSTCAGIVTKIPVAQGQEIKADATLLTVDSTDSWQAVVAVDELDINTIELGQSVDVALDAMPNETFIGVVVSISDYGSASGGITTYDVQVAIDDNDSFKLSMTLSCEIETQSAADVVLAPIDAVRTSVNQNYVMVAIERSDAEIEIIKQLITANDYSALVEYMSDDAQALGIKMLPDWSELLYGEVRAVEVGIQDAFYAQIISGLQEGETVLLTASDSTGDISDKFLPGMVPGMGGGAGGGQRPNQ